VSTNEIRVLVIGAGGLGTPALYALGAAGVRHVTILEPDRVELTNLHRQILFRERDVGEPKAVVAKRALLERFPRMSVEAIPGAFSSETDALLGDHELVLDGTDRFETKLAISDGCVDHGVRYVFAGVVGFEGQALGTLPGRSACLRCLFEEAPPPGSAPTCAEVGILGPIAGIVAAKQVEIGLSLFGSEPLVDRLYAYDGTLDRERWVKLRRDPLCRGCGSDRSRRGAFDGLDLAPAEISAPVLDLQGEVCPNTFIAARRALDRLPTGGRIWVYLDSDESLRSLPASLAAAGHRLLARSTDGRLHRLLVERAEDEVQIEDRIEGALR
jgi:molybdopterin-synthase adenylyltransferase